MIPIQYLGKILILIGLMIALMGLMMFFGGKIPFIGKLPGDFVLQRKNFTFYFPLSTIIILNLLIYLIFSLFKK